jgi:hypothetical protein
MRSKNIFTIMLIAFIALLGLSNCNPNDEGDECRNFPPEYYKLSEEQKAMMPYTGYDTINMVNNKGDTIHCIGAGKQYFNTREFELYANPECAAQGKGTEMFYEAYKIEFVDSVKNEKLELIHYKYAPNYGISGIDFKFKNERFFILDYNISDIRASNYINSVEINKRVYLDVNKVQSNLSDTLKFIFINKSNGILKLHLNQVNTWELIPN